VQIIPNLTSLALSGLQTSFNFALKSLNESINNYTLNIFSPTNISSSSFIPSITLPGLDPNYVSSSSSVISSSISSNITTSSVQNSAASSSSSIITPATSGSSVNSNSNDTNISYSEEPRNFILTLLLVPLIITSLILAIIAISKIAIKTKANNKRKKLKKDRKNNDK
jgi:hypothetical protein